ncbi:electron transport complex protein RnfG [Marivirga sericea]|uniref:Ion-translocating oxidoreductase complex subunit G n=1 Tax=Marivirga sericea TaxID=1028 RepID=A0A1X7IFP7_9BACT|nr:FMN-binding protein [Marivirga sericea]SMG13182.1 electron transport complex protein RnfG [Marivirga sericea]
MNKQETIAPNSFKMIRAMAGIGILCGLLIVFTYEGTKPRIETLRAEALKEAIFKVIPGSTQMQPYVYQDNTFKPANKSDEDVIYAGYDDSGVFKGLAIVAAGQGYADIIRIIYGYSIDQQEVIGFYVLESKETPGLGDKIEKDPDFLDNFTDLDVSLNEDKDALKNKVTTVKSGSKVNEYEIDGITGATISSRAIEDIIASSAEKWMPIIHKNRSIFKNIDNE